MLAARTDGLTGCLNHAAMHEALRREIVRCERTGHRLSLVLVDMDDFKQVNEEHGHLVGDEVLRRVGHALRQAVRPYDLVARYGGDEFAVVTIDADEEEASEVAGRALDGVRRSLDDLSAAPGATGASAGVAEWCPGQSSTALIEAADRALLFGKQEGERGESPPTARELRPVARGAVSIAPRARAPSLLTNDYQGLPDPATSRCSARPSSALAVPMHWDGELRGVLTVAFRRDHVVTNDHLKLLEAFGELAAAACRNASAHAGLVLAARTDGLTGCLNHAAMHEALRREIVRCERTGHRLSLVLVDMDDFKQVNEEHGHLVGDEVLRRVGHALRQAVRPYDLVARYGGDEFAIVTVDADEEEASEVAGRALDGVRRSLDDLSAAPGATGASAGVAEWSPGQSSTALIEAADRALLFGKQEGERGEVTTKMPEDYRPGRSRRRADRPERPLEPMPEPAPPRRRGRGRLARPRAASRPSGCASAPSSCRWPTRWACAWPA